MPETDPPADVHPSPRPGAGTLLARAALACFVAAAFYWGGQRWSAYIADPPTLPVDPLVARAQEAEARGESIPLRLDAKLVSPWQVRPLGREVDTQFIGEGFEHVVFTPQDKYERTYDLIVARATRLLPGGTRWRCAFRLRATQPRAVRFAVHEPMPPWKNVGVDETLRVGTEWQSFAFEFATVAQAQQLLVNWELGGDATPVEIEGVQLDPLETPGRGQAVEN